MALIPITDGAAIGDAIKVCLEADPCKTVLCDCCCEEECSSDCSDCETNCDGGDINVTVSYTPCDGADDCAGLSGGSGTLVNDGSNSCFWDTDGAGGSTAGDFGVWVFCDNDIWTLHVFDDASGFECASFNNVICVLCVSSRPTGVFSVPVTDFSERDFACSSAIVTLSIP